jgi:hypothetical protein
VKPREWFCTPFAESDGPGYRAAMLAVFRDARMWADPLVRDYISPELVALAEKTWGRRRELLALTRPVARTLCHWDLSPANVFVSPGERTTVIDWAQVGAGALGEDLANLFLSLAGHFQLSGSAPSFCPRDRTGPSRHMRPAPGPDPWTGGVEAHQCGLAGSKGAGARGANRAHRQAAAGSGRARAAGSAAAPVTMPTASVTGFARGLGICGLGIWRAPSRRHRGRPGPRSFGRGRVHLDSDGTRSGTRGRPLSPSRFGVVGVGGGGPLPRPGLRVRRAPVHSNGPSLASSPQLAGPTMS